MTGSVPPAGWYPDPSNEQQLRWWTGERWTGAARPVDFEEPQVPGLARSEPGVGGGPVGSGAGWASGAGGNSGAYDGSTTAEPVVPDATREVSAVPASSGATVRSGSAPARQAAHWAERGASADERDTVERGGIAAWPRERMIAAVAIGGLLLTSIAIWLVAVVLTGPSEPDTVAGGTTPADDDEVAADEDAVDGDEPPVVEDQAGETTTEVEEDDRTIDFDGVCTVEVDAAEAERGGTLRPWQFAECAHAPVNLDGVDGRWIVVVASIDGDLDADEASSRAQDHGSGLGLLWSSHYPSLNPGWWVVYDGPFAEEDAAAEVSDDIGGGSYPRLLSDDEGDRYCIAEDGC